MVVQGTLSFDEALVTVTGWDNQRSLSHPCPSRRN